MLRIKTQNGLIGGIHKALRNGGMVVIWKKISNNSILNKKKNLLILNDLNITN
jgi:hypothetical protein